MIRSVAPLALSFACAALLVPPACSDARSHIYAGRLYRPARDCVDTSTSIEVVDGTDPGTCAPVCVASPVPTDGGARALYVSTMCAPYPPFFDSSQSVSGCAEALAASARNDTCMGDAGSTNRRDAGAADSGGDASSDAANDAPPE